MTKELKDLISQMKGKTLSRDEVVTQIRSAAYGDLAIEDPSTSRSGIDRAVDLLILQEKV